jgi:Rrf2 family protein
MERIRSLIRQDSDYGVRALLHLATAADGRATAAQVAAAGHIPNSFLYKVMKKLQKAKFIASRPGRKGGFQLKVDPK